MRSFLLPGSKSVSNRALVLSALSPRPTRLKGLLESDDIRYLKQALSGLGVAFEPLPGGDTHVIPPERLHGSGQRFFIGNGGTPARFLSALSLVTTGSFTLEGIPRMHERPFGDLFATLRELGVTIMEEGSPDCLPASFSGAPGGDHPVSVSLSGKASSQFVSGLLMAATRLPHPLEVHIPEPIPSAPYVQMSVDILRIFGADIEADNTLQHFRITPGLENPDTFMIPADSSSASYPLAYSMLARTPMHFPNYGARTFQGDEQFLYILTDFGARIERTGDALTIHPPDTFTGRKTYDFSSMPDVSMTGMILAALREGETTFTGLHSLRVKECDRIAAMKEGFLNLGFTCSDTPDTLTITGNPNIHLPKNVTINAHDDHRIAMCFGVLRAALGADFEITDPECVSKSWPDFWLDLADWQGALRPVSALILRKGDRFLLVRKPRKNHSSQFPQGGIDPGETPKEAALRELREECGATLQAEFLDIPVHSYAYFFPQDFHRHDKDIVGAKVHFFTADYTGGNIEVDGQEIVEADFYTPEEIAKRVDPEYFEVVEPILKTLQGNH